MCRRRFFAAIGLALFMSACASETPETDNSAEPTLAPDSLALVDETPTDGGPLDSFDAPDAAVALPEGTTLADLPVGLEDRLAVMTSWLRGFEPAKNAGNEPMVIDGSGAVDLHFLVRTTTADEAEGLCSIYSAAGELYSADSTADLRISLSGWVLSDAGVFVDPGWGTVTCDA